MCPVGRLAQALERNARGDLFDVRIADRTPWNTSVCTGPGDTTLTVMPGGASASDQARAVPSMPALAARLARPAS